MYIRTTVRYVVSKDFFCKGWITKAKNTYDLIISSRSNDREPSNSLSDNFVRNASDNGDSQKGIGKAKKKRKNRKKEKAIKNYERTCRP